MYLLFIGILFIILSVMIFSLRSVPRYHTFKQAGIYGGNMHIMVTNNTDKRLYQISIPNITQPSGHNSSAIYFKVIGRNLVDYSLQIHDRNGKLVYESKDLNAGWNGKTNNTEASEGMYYYFVNAKGKTIDGYENIERSGSFVLVK